VSTVGLLATGLFVSFFIGDQIILSGIKREKKLVEKAETEVKEEEAVLFSISARLDRMETDLRTLAEEVRDTKKL
jgi:putative Mn2+ efflux pump MntP